MIKSGREKHRHCEPCEVSRDDSVIHEFLIALTHPDFDSEVVLYAGDGLVPAIGCRIRWCAQLEAFFVKVLYVGIVLKLVWMILAGAAPSALELVAACACAAFATIVPGRLENWHMVGV